MSCGFDITCHVTGWFWSIVALVPWWAWIIAAILAAVAVWRLFGWAGVVILAGIAGFVLGRRDEPFPTDLPEKDARPPIRRRTAKREHPKSLIERVTGRPED